MQKAWKRHSSVYCLISFTSFFLLFLSLSLSQTRTQLACLSDRAQIWLPQPMINDNSYPQRLSFSLSSSCCTASYNTHTHTRAQSHTQQQQPGLFHILLFRVKSLVLPKKIFFRSMERFFPMHFLFVIECQNFFFRFFFLVLKNKIYRNHKNTLES